VVLRLRQIWARRVRRKPTSRLLVLGAGERARELARELESDPLSPARVIGFLDDTPRPQDREALGARYLGAVSELARLAPEHTIGRVVYALPRSELGARSVVHAVGVCEMLGVPVTIPLDLYDTRAASVVPRKLAGRPAFSLEIQSQHPGWKLAVKRGIDIVGATIVLVLALPVMAVVAAAIKRDSPGPVFYGQARCGRHGREFRFWKFRTMYVGSEARAAEIQELNEQSGPVFKAKHDPRVTKVGRFLRRYSIDEMPQLLNVLAGQMSLVGPRPPLPSEVSHYELDHRGRLSMRPGITCLWQISGRNEIPFEDWVKLDLEYLERWSLSLDMAILVATVPAVLSGRGAS